MAYPGRSRGTKRLLVPDSLDSLPVAALRRRIAKIRNPLIDLLIMCGDTIDGFLDLRMVLHLRSSLIAFCVMYHPCAKPRLWDCIRPSLGELSKIAPIMSVSGADLFAGLFSGNKKYDYEEMLERIACVSGNLPLAQRYWAVGGSLYGGGIPIFEQSVETACEYGHVKLVEWFMTGYQATADGNRRMRNLLVAAAKSGNVETATVLIRSTYAEYDTEDGFILLKIACDYENLPFAAWVLQSYPIAPTSDQICEIAKEAPYAMRMLIESFDLSWEDVAGLYRDMWTEFDTATDPKLIRIYMWMKDRYDADWAPEFELLCVPLTG